MMFHSKNYEMLMNMGRLGMRLDLPIILFFMWNIWESLGIYAAKFNLHFTDDGTQVPISII